MNDGNAIPQHRGRGAQIRPHNRFRKVSFCPEPADDLPQPSLLTQVYVEHPRRIINRVTSPDVGMEYSANPYQGCEHGCVYCYARNTHTYWGWDAGLDFETRIIIKPDAALLLEQEITRPDYVVKPIMFSGNTDCYQPLERKFKLTRSMLEVLARYHHPAGIITKNALILRDLDLLEAMAAKRLVQVTISITTLNEALRRLLEPRTVPGARRLDVVAQLSRRGIPVNVNVAPVIPFLNSDEIPELVRQAADAGASSCSMLLVRLNGDVALIFTDWLQRHFPDRASRVLQAIRDLHGGSLSDHRFGLRMKGEGHLAQSIGDLFHLACRKYLGHRLMPKLDVSQFKRPLQQGTLFP